MRILILTIRLHVNGSRGSSRGCGSKGKPNLSMTTSRCSSLSPPETVISNLSFQLSSASDGSVGDALEEDCSADELTMTSTSPSFSSIGGSAPDVIGLLFGVFGRATGVDLSSVKSNCGDIRLERIDAIAVSKDCTHRPTSEGGRSRRTIEVGRFRLSRQRIRIEAARTGLCQCSIYIIICALSGS